MVLDFEEIFPEPPMKDIPYTLIHDGKTYNKTKSIEWDFGKYGKLDWHDWRCMFWGTKWNLDGYVRKDFINGDLFIPLIPLGLLQLELFGNLSGFSITSSSSVSSLNLDVFLWRVWRHLWFLL